MPITLSENEVRERLKKVHSDNIILIGEYTRTHNKAHFKCKKGHDFYSEVKRIMAGGGCPLCASNHRIQPHEMALRIFKEFNGKLTLDETTYIDTNSKAKLTCNDCGYVFYSRINALLRNKKKGKRKDVGCPKCSHRLTPNVDEVIKKINLMYNNSITFNKNDYKLTDTKIKFHCSKCNHTFISQISRLINKNSGCPTCSLHSMEVPVIEILDKKKVNYLHDKALKDSNYKGSKYPLRADFQFLDYPLIIETDGQQHFTSRIGGINDYKYTVERDLHKNKYCKEHNICLIRVTSSPTKKWGTEKHIILSQLINLIERGISDDGIIDMNVFTPYDYNKI